MSQVEIIAVATIAIARKQRVAILGSLLLFVGVFLPLVSTPLGSVNYFDNGQGDGAIVLALAVISIILALTRSFGWLWITGLCSDRSEHATWQRQLFRQRAGRWGNCLSVSRNLNHLGTHSQLWVALDHRAVFSWPTCVLLGHHPKWIVTRPREHAD